MSLPVVVCVVLALLAALGGGVAVALNWETIVVALKGKRVAVLGARGVGKTHLVNFLSTGSIPEEYKQTVAPDKASKRRFQLKDLDLKVKDSLDVPGDTAAYAEWKKQHDEADVVLYLLRADRLIARDSQVENRVKDDLKHIQEWLDARKERPHFLIVGTHCDLDPGFADLSPDKVGQYVDDFRKLPTVVELVARGGGAQRTKVVIGTMKTIPDTEALVYQVFMQVAS